MNDHIKNAKTELHMFINSPAKEHLEVAKVNAMISIAEGLFSLLGFLKDQARQGTLLLVPKTDDNGNGF